MRANIGTLQSLHTGAGYSSERTSKNAFTLPHQKLLSDSQRQAICLVPVRNGSLDSDQSPESRHTAIANQTLYCGCQNCGLASPPVGKLLWAADLVIYFQRI